MVLCKYFQQGTCRFGQYCKFEHSFGNRSKTFNNEEKNIALLVAEEILHAERGGQWLLSCYGPFKEKKCIPGMDDFSPEEVRWEMYQAQKTGTVDQVNAQFQQMCEAMKQKREALKNPTPPIVQILEEIQNSGTDANKGNFAFGASQLATMPNTSQTPSVFGQKTFGVQNNPFGGSTFNSTQPASSIFGRATTSTTSLAFGSTASTTNSVFGSNTNTTGSVFGGKPTFGNAPVFGGTSTNAANSIFGGANKPAITAFGGTQNAPSFGGIASQGTSIFGGSTAPQSTFGQPAASASTGVFGSTAAQPTNSLFKPQTGQMSVFGASNPASTNVFGASSAVAPTPQGSVFGSTTVTPAATNPTSGAGLFGQAATTNTAFGGAPVFGGTAAFGAQAQTAPGSVFGGQSTFGATTAAAPQSNVFGGSNAGTASFETLAQAPATNSAFGATSSVAPNASPFGASASSTTAPFGNAGASVFATTASSTPAAGPFGTSMSFGFATPTTNTTNVFGTTTSTSTTQSPFGSPAFGSTQPVSNTSVFGTTTSSPFMTKPQQQNKASPFGVASSTQSSPFGNFAVGSNNAFGVSMTVVIDETAYSPDNCLTDDEKAIYKMKAFPEGLIPLKPPTKELR